MLNRTFAVLTLLVLIVLFPTAGTALTGGPDAGGYTFYDSTEREASSFSWDDITLEKNFKSLELPINTVSAAIPIGFTFTFYGKTYSEIHVSSRGYLTFEGMPDNISGLEFQAADPIPTPGGADDNFIAGLWGYLRTDV